MRSWPRRRKKWRRKRSLQYKTFVTRKYSLVLKFKDVYTSAFSRHSCTARRARAQTDSSLLHRDRPPQICFDLARSTVILSNHVGQGLAFMRVAFLYIDEYVIGARCILIGLQHPPQRVIFGRWAHRPGYVWSGVHVGGGECVMHGDKLSNFTIVIVVSDNVY